MAKKSKDSSFEESILKVNDFETRSPMFLKKMSDDVKARVEQRAEQFEVCNWVVVEVILKDALGIKQAGIDLNKFLGINANRARVGKPSKKKVSR